MTNLHQQLMVADKGYLVYFDNVRVDQFVKDYSVQMTTNGQVGTAVINMVYVPDFDKIIHKNSVGKDRDQTKQSKSKPKTTAGDGGRPGEVANCYALIVRSSASWGNNIIGYIHPKFRGYGDHKVTAYETKDGWIRIKWYDAFVHKKWMYGWTGPRYIKITGPAAPKIVGDSFVEKGVYYVDDDGIDAMTNVKIFVKNIYSEKYVQIFDGNVTGKAITKTGNIRSLSIQCQDYMNWLNRTICPIAVPFDGTLTPGDRLRWKAQGIDLDKVKSVNSLKDVTFKGKTLSQTWQIISDQTIKANKLYSNSSTVAHWDAALERVVVMGDIDEKLRKAEVMDFMISTSISQVSNIYVLMNDVLKSLVFEFYQDRDGTIRIKPPFWNEHVLKNHVIDSSHIVSYTESCDYDKKYTRVIATGGLEDWQEDTDDQVTKSLITPVVAVTSGGVTANSGPVVVTSEAGGGSSGGGSSSGGGGSIGAEAVKVAERYLGWPYVWGGDTPGEGGFDCSGLIDYAYRQAGYSGFKGRQTTYTLMKLGTRVSSLSDVQPGDLVFPHADHVYMVVNKSKLIHAPQTGDVVKYRSMVGSAMMIRRLSSGSSGGSSSGKPKVYEKPTEVGPDSLLEPTYLEKRYGPLVYDCSQPLIKFTTSGATNSKNAYDALQKYARFMINYLNSSVTLANMQVVAMPWLRPGFNVWVDPLGTDKIYYVNSINHYGNASGNFSTLSMTMGRRRTDFLHDKNTLGALKPGSSDDIFVNKLMVTPSNFGTVCNYDETIKRLRGIYETSGKTLVIRRTKMTNNLCYFYKDFGKGNQYSKSVKGSSSSSTHKGVVHVNSALNVRTGPSTKYKVVGTLRNGNEVTIYSEKSGWYEITYGGKKRWVCGKYVTKLSGNSSGVVKVHTALNVRTGPSTKYAIVGSLHNGNKITIYKQKNGWYEISYKGKKRWVCGKYVTKPSPAKSKPDPSSVYKSHSGKVVFSDQYTIGDIQNKLNGMYSGATSIVKNRSKKIASLVNDANKRMAEMNVGKYLDKPINPKKGSN